MKCGLGVDISTGLVLLDHSTNFYLTLNNILIMKFRLSRSLSY